MSLLIRAIIWLTKPNIRRLGDSINMTMSFQMSFEVLNLHLLQTFEISPPLLSTKSSRLRLDHITLQTYNTF
jgi:hypothetical protein